MYNRVTVEFLYFDFQIWYRYVWLSAYSHCSFLSSIKFNRQLLCVRLTWSPTRLLRLKMIQYESRDPVKIQEKEDNAHSVISPVRVNPPPDGGFHAWVQVVSGHLVVALTWDYAASFGVFQDYYEATPPQSPSDISWIGGFQVFCLLFVSTLSGRVTDAGMAKLVVGGLQCGRSLCIVPKHSSSPICRRAWHLRSFPW